MAVGFLGAGEPEYAQVWAAGEVSNSVVINTYRILAVVKTASGRLVAFCEARKDSVNDVGVIGVAKKYSDNGGTTWSNFVGGDYAVPSDATYMFGNPTAVVKGSRIWLFCNRQRQDDTQNMVLIGTSTDTRRVFVTYSDDDGETFAAPTEITTNAKPAGHRWHACGPGGAMVTSGGRIIVPYNSSDTSQLYRAGVFYSDDDGVNWVLGAQASTTGANEAEVVELTGGNLLLNCRRFPVTAEKNRLEFVSTDSGATWGAGAAAEQLLDPSVDASLINVGGTLLFSNPKDTTNRVNLTIRKSLNSGVTWSSGLRISALGGDSAYSALVDLGGGRVGCLWERDAYQMVAFTAAALGDL